ncbi:hypothetical protein [Streptomyces acidiscabies]|uniref:Uncharacterized protein n=1 Tax=Streptomyces acidiscabies TaxID=42234 RepID=A0AAP6BKC5_9ACTN|nr:hypothetical protein [Streptomyces acidiscabies]MBP5936901.1 hypothetical protein [Streptomyces sp. LBUM 1476]MBZ3915071.1 hypothetical protein [Streptomyces acidiscabies]MDX2966308.1 hypothetical protein [Streptomyces acidiscabies]MDX3021134.1 hypothetical protein [Streptomyces acidiscabies]MDX3794809.1 hypothetical protein [Streptomyces acidiscabies]
MKRRPSDKRSLTPSAAQLAALGSATSAALLAVLSQVSVTVTLSQGQHQAAIVEQPVRPVCPL